MEPSSSEESDEDVPDAYGSTKSNANQGGGGQNGGLNVPNGAVNGPR